MIGCGVKEAVGISWLSFGDRNTCCSSVVQVPRQCNTLEENTCLRMVRFHPHRKRNQTNCARRIWMLVDFRKNGVTHYGYKNHIMVDHVTKLIANWDVTAANVHDDRFLRCYWTLLFLMILRIGQTVSINQGKGLVVYVRWYSNLGSILMGKRGTALIPSQKVLYYAYSKVHCRTEHVFGLIRNGTGSCYMTCIGLDIS